jgi:hypothetical protein
MIPQKTGGTLFKKNIHVCRYTKVEHIKVIDRGQMIKKIYPLDHFIGELKAKKQKIDFRENS